jgi:hypothetical protein
MAKWGNCDFNKLRDLQNKLNRIQQGDIEKFAEECAKELAARLLAKVIKRTPVGQYPTETGKKGGTLRRGWTSESEREAELTAAFGGGSAAKAYAESLKVNKVGNVYQIEIVNPVHYASYAEYGHRTRDHKGWIQGRFMLTISEQELETQSASILERKLMKYLGECFDA